MVELAPLANAVVTPLSLQVNLEGNVPMKAVAATNKFMIGVTAVESALLFLARLVNPYVIAPVVLGTSVGATAGMWIMLRRKAAC